MIPAHALLDLLNQLCGTRLRNDPSWFDYWMKKGVDITPVDLNYEHKATLARIAAGESWEGYP